MLHCLVVQRYQVSVASMKFLKGFHLNRLIVCRAQIRRILIRVNASKGFDGYWLHYVVAWQFFICPAFSGFCQFCHQGIHLCRDWCISSWEFVTTREVPEQRFTPNIRQQGHAIRTHSCRNTQTIWLHARRVVSRDEGMFHDVICLTVARRSAFDFAAC